MTPLAKLARTSLVFKFLLQKNIRKVPDHSQNLLSDNRGLFFQSVQQSHEELNNFFSTNLVTKMINITQFSTLFRKKTLKNLGISPEINAQYVRVHLFSLFEI